MLWSTGGIGVKVLELSPWTILFFRSLFALPVFLFWTIRSMGPGGIRTLGHTMGRALPVSLFIACSFLFYVFSLDGTTVADSLLIQGTAPIFIMVLGTLLLKERIPPISVGALILVLTGIGTILLPSLKIGGFSGNLFGLAKALSFAVATIIIRSKKSVGTMEATTLAALLALFLAIPGVPSFSLTRGQLIILFYLGTVQIGISFLLFTSWSGKLSSSQTGLIVILEAVLGPLWPWIFMGTVPGRLTLAGGSFILFALISHSLLYPRHRT